MTILFFFLFGCIAGALLCRQGPQGTPGPPGPQGPVARDVDPTGALYPMGHNLARRQAVVEEQLGHIFVRVYSLEERMRNLQRQ